MKAGELVIDAEGMVMKGILYSPIEIPLGTKIPVRMTGITIGIATTASCTWDGPADEYRVEIAIEIKDLP